MDDGPYMIAGATLERGLLVGRTEDVTVIGRAAALNSISAT